MYDEFMYLLESVHQNIAINQNLDEGRGRVKDEGFKLGVSGKKEFLQVDSFRSMLLKGPADDGHSEGGLKVAGLVGSVVYEHRDLAVGHNIGEFPGITTGKENQPFKILACDKGNQADIGLCDCRSVVRGQHPQELLLKKLSHLTLKQDAIHLYIPL